MLERLTQIYLEETSAIPLNKLIAAIAIALFCGMLIGIVYRVTFRGVLFSRTFILGLVLMSMITCCIVVAISSNLVLSLGMVGALSIVRFRTAIKEPMDTVFMFWALTAGILTGAGFMILSVVCTAAIGVIYILLERVTVGLGRRNACTILVRGDIGEKSLSQAVLQAFPHAKIRSVRINGDETEIIAEARLNARERERSEKLGKLPGVKEVNFVDGMTSV